MATTFLFQHARAHPDTMERSSDAAEALPRLIDAFKKVRIRMGADMKKSFDDLAALTWRTTEIEKRTAALEGNAHPTPAPESDASLQPEDDMFHNAEAHFYDDQAAGTRFWPRCTFQSIRTTPIDRALFVLLGGRLLESTGSLDGTHHNCDVWSNPTRAWNCACSAPLRLLGARMTFVEIGANDGLHMSNSYFFERYLGWRGMCVEANPHTYRQLQRHRPRCVNVNALVGPRTDQLPRAARANNRLPFVAFYRPNATVKLDSARDWETGLSGVLSPHSEKEVLRSLKRAKRFARENELQLEHTLLPVETFDDLFRKHDVASIDVLTVDVEGFELPVLSSIDFERVHIRYVVTEMANPNVSTLLLRHGFRDLGLHFELGDRIFANTVRHRTAGERVARRATWTGRSRRQHNVSRQGGERASRARPAQTPARVSWFG